MSTPILDRDTAAALRQWIESKLAENRGRGLDRHRAGAETLQALLGVLDINAGGRNGGSAPVRRVVRTLPETLEAVWFWTHVDEREVVNGVRMILVKRAGVRLLVPLDNLDTFEVRSRLPESRVA